MAVTLIIVLEIKETTSKPERKSLTKDTQAASSRILTRRSSNCSTTNSHSDLPARDRYEKSGQTDINI